MGTDLGGCSEIVDLFESFGCAVQPTAPCSSSMNAMGESPHQSIAQGIRTMLGGAKLPPKHWPFAFHMHLRICNCVMHKDADMSPFQKCTGVPPNLKKLRAFGCHVTVLPKGGERAAKA